MPPNPNRPTSRTSSVPIPGSAPRSIEDILNFNSISPPGTSTSPHRERTQNSITRSLYSGLEGGRPTITNRHASASTSVGASRSALGGGSGPPWGARSASVSAATVLPGSFGVHPVIQGFEPRVIGGRTGGTTTERLPSAATAAQDGRAQTGPMRRMSTGTHPSIHSIYGMPAVHRHASSMSVGHSHGHHMLGSGAPVPFLVPSYLQHSSLHDMLQTDTGTPAATPRPTIFSASGRDVTPFTESDEDSESSSSLSRPPYPRERGRIRERPNAYTVSSAILSADIVMHLPTRWNDQDRNKFLTISEDGRNLLYHGPSSSNEKDAAAARANYPMPPGCGIYYYEVTVLDKGSKGHISVGFSCAGVKLNRLPGWEKNSWGYHGDDGHSFASEREGSSFGPKFATGDTIGCGVDFSTHRAFFTKEGSLIGYAFENIGLDGVDIYPSVGLRTSGEHIRVNFGQEPFKFNVDDHVYGARECSWKKIQTTPIRWTIDEDRDVFELEKDKSTQKPFKSSETVAAPAVKTEVKQEPQDEEFVPIELPPDYSEPINKLVLSYLQHHGYERTAKAFKTQFDSKKLTKASYSEDLSMKKVEDDYVDIKMETDDGLPVATIDGFESPFDLDRIDGLEREPIPDAQQQRQRIVSAVQNGNMDLALRLLQDWFPAVFEVDRGFLLLKLKSRKFVELILQASDAMRTYIDEALGEVKSSGTEPGPMDIDDEDTPGAMNGLSPVDANAPPISSTAPALKSCMKRSTKQAPPSPALQRYQGALGDALTYGKVLNADYPRTGSDARPEVVALLKTTFSLVTYDDPRTVNAEIRAFCSPEVRTVLAQEVNQAILESQGRPSRPALERLYRQTSVVLTQLALMGMGDAAFADMQEEFLDS